MAEAAEAPVVVFRAGPWTPGWLPPHWSNSMLCTSKWAKLFWQTHGRLASGGSGRPRPPRGTAPALLLRLPENGAESTWSPPPRPREGLLRAFSFSFRGCSGSRLSLVGCPLRASPLAAPPPPPPPRRGDRDRPAGLGEAREPRASGCSLRNSLRMSKKLCSGHALHVDGGTCFRTSAEAGSAPCGGPPGALCVLHVALAEGDHRCCCGSAAGGRPGRGTGPPSWNSHP